MRVLFINSVCGVGSTGRMCTDLSDVLIHAGHECRIAYGREEVPENYRTIAIKIGSAWDVGLHAISSRLLDKSGFGSKAVTRNFLKWVEHYNPDIIHLHNIHGYYINVRELFDYLSMAGKIVVWTLHDCWAFTGHCAHFDYIGCNKWRTGCFKCPQKLEYPRCVGFDKSKANYCKKKSLFTTIPSMSIISPSNWLAQLVRQSFLGKYPIKVINNGINLDIFKPRESAFRSKHNLERKIIVLGVANSWSSRKGLEDIVQLATILPETYQVVLVGLTKKQAEKLPSGILGISKTSDGKMLAEIYSAADVFVNPTYEDNYPTVNLEAIACGTPVITYNTGGSSEALNKGCGLALDDKDAESLGEAIKQFNLSSNVRSECHKVSKAFDRQLRYKEYLNLYCELIDKHF